MSRMFESMVRRGAGLGPAPGMQTLGPRPMSRFERAAPELGGNDMMSDAPVTAAAPPATGRNAEGGVPQTIRQREGAPAAVSRTDPAAHEPSAPAAPWDIEIAAPKVHGAAPSPQPIVPAARPLSAALSTLPQHARATDARPATDALPTEDAHVDAPLRAGHRADAVPAAPRAPLAGLPEATRWNERDDGKPLPALPVERTPSPRGEWMASAAVEKTAPQVERAPPSRRALPVAASPAAMIAPQASSAMRGDVAQPPLSVSIGRIEIAFAPSPVPPAAPAGPQRTRGFSDLAGARRGVLR